MAKSADILYVGTGRHVVAINPASGDELWRTRLPSRSGNIVSLLPAGDQLFAGHAGRVYALNTRDGSIQWENPLRGTGYQAVMMALPGAVASMASVIAAAQAAADAAAASAAV